MKKLAIFMMAACLAAGFSSCEDDNNNGAATETLSGFYTINGGNKSGKIPASITAYDYTTGEVTDPMQDAFEAANGIALGDGAQQAFVYGDKMFIVMYSSNLIWVVNPTDLTILGSIQPEGDAQSPRYLAEKNGKLYCTMYTGYVSEIDPTTLKITRSVKVGPNPDQLAVWNNKLVVACSDGQNSKGLATNGVKYGNSCVSIVDLSTFTETKIQDLDVIYNPTDVVSNGTDVFVNNKGNYSSDDATLIRSNVVKLNGTELKDVVKVCNGTNMAINGKTLYVIYAQSGKPRDEITYKKYNVDTLQEIGEIANQSSEEAKIAYPGGVFVDPVSGNIVMLSYTLDSAGSAQYRLPSYANIYDNAGNFSKRVECGVGARGVTFVREKVAK